MTGRRAAEAVLDGLLAPTGAVDNGRLPAVPRAAPRPSARRTSAVVVVQPGIGPWRCDSCRRLGSGGFGLLAHFAATGHAWFSPRATHRAR